MWLVFGFALLCVPPSSARWQNSLLVQNWLPENNPLSSSKWSPAAFNTQTSLRSQSPPMPPLLTPPTNQMQERAKNMSSEMKSFRIKLGRGVRSYVQCGCNVLAKFWRLVGCSTFFPEKTPKNSLFWRTRFRGFLTLGGAVCQTIGPRSTIGVPLKSLGYNGSN